MAEANDVLSSDQLGALVTLARGPRAPELGEAATLKQLAEQGLAQLETIAGRKALYHITPAGRRAIATSPLRPQPGPSRRLADRTIAELLSEGRVIFSECRSCAHRAPIDLDLMAWRLGGKTVLAERADRCLRPGCHGILSYRSGRAR